MIDCTTVEREHRVTQHRAPPSTSPRGTGGCGVWAPRQHGAGLPPEAWRQVTTEHLYSFVVRAVSVPIPSAMLANGLIDRESQR